MFPWLSTSASATTGTKRTKRSQKAAELQSAKNLLHDRGSGAGGILADLLLLLAQHEIEAVERLLRHVGVEVGVLLLHQAVRRALRGVLVVFARELHLFRRL